MVVKASGFGICRVAFMVSTMLHLARGSERHDSVFLRNCTDCLKAGKYNRTAAFDSRRNHTFTNATYANEPTQPPYVVLPGAETNSNVDDVATIPPTIPPTNSPMIADPSSSGPIGPTSIDILVAVFFLISACWLFVAIVYSCLILIVLRLQSRGELDVYDESFGSFSFFNGRVSLNIGFLLRRYAIQIEREQRMQSERSNGEGGEETSRTRIHFMTREERRMAMELLLNAPRNEKKVVESETPQGDCSSDASIRTAPQSVRDLETGSTCSEEPVCSICLCEYEAGDQMLSSATCPHKFHQACIMDWLERRANTDCPCCRSEMVSDDDVWSVVKRHRRKNQPFPRPDCIFRLQNRRRRRQQSARRSGSDRNDILVDAGDTERSAEAVDIPDDNPGNGTSISGNESCEGTEDAIAMHIEAEETLQLENGPNESIPVASEGAVDGEVICNTS